MLGECESLAPRKKTLNFISLFLSLLAGIFMIVACASYSAKWQTIQKLSFMTMTADLYLNDPATGKKYDYILCTYVGLQGACSAACGKSQTVYQNNIYTGKVTALPDDAPTRNCNSSVPIVNFVQNKVVITGYKSNIQIYKDVQKQDNLNQCKGSPDSALAPGEPKGGVTINQKCATMAACQSGGNTTMAFAILGCIAALLAMVAFAWRMNSDGVCPKVTAFILAGVAFICCTTAFGAFQPCARKFYDAEKQALEALIATQKYEWKDASETFSVRPGVGGAMAVTSFVFFIYVWLMSIFVPNAEPAGTTNSGLDNKAPQV
jgi:hypothetical protein